MHVSIHILSSRFLILSQESWATASSQRCRQVYLARVDKSRGPLLHVYEDDRHNGTVWLVNMMIANGSVFVHPRLTNPSDCDLRGY